MSTRPRTFAPESSARRRTRIFATAIVLAVWVGDRAHGDEVQRFDILHFIVDGNSVLPPTAIEAAIYPNMGPAKTIDDVEAARKALEAAYHAAGYQTVFVDIPEQEVQGGVVRLVAREGRIEQMKITGSRYFSLGRIRATVPELAEGRVPQMERLERQLTALGTASPDREVTPILRAGSTPGTVAAELKVKDRLPLHGGIELNTRSAVNTSATRLIGSLRYDNLWQRFHSASLQYQVAPQAMDVEVWAGTYVLPLGASPWRIAFYGIGIDSETPVAAAGALSVVGTGNIFGLRGVRLLPMVGAWSQTLSLGVDYKDFGQSIVLVGADTQDSPITYLPFTARYEGSYRHADDSRTSAGIEANASFRGFGNDQQAFENRRFLARSNYLYVVGDVEHVQTLPRGFRLRGRFAGQLADSPLISNEQYALGGALTVRGYHETEVLGDDGLSLLVELHGPIWTPLDAVALHALVFGDAGAAFVKDPLPDTQASYSLASAGFGFRLDGAPLSAQLDWAWALLTADAVEAGDPRLHLQVNYAF